LATEYYGKVVAVAGDGDTTRIEVSTARAFLQKR
jgi:hypothetical protein